MSYSLNTVGAPGDLATKVQEAFDAQSYGDIRSKEKIEQHVSRAISAVEDFADLLKTKDNGQFAVSIYGHANLGETDTARDSCTIQITPVTVAAGSGG